MVYFLWSKEQNAVKIGYSGVSVPGRLSTAETYNPSPLEILACIPGERSDEKALHARFKEHQIRKEWFRCHPELMDFIKTLQPMPQAVSVEDTLECAEALLQEAGEDFWMVCLERVNGEAKMTLRLHTCPLVVFAISSYPAGYRPRTDPDGYIVDDGPQCDFSEDLIAKARLIANAPALIRRLADELNERRK